MAKPQEPANKEQMDQVLKLLKNIEQIALSNERQIKRILENGTPRD